MITNFDHLKELITNNDNILYVYNSGMIFLRFLPEFRFFGAVQGHSCGNPRTGLKIWAIFIGGGGGVYLLGDLIDLLLSRLNTVLQCFINPIAYVLTIHPLSLTITLFHVTIK